MSTNEIATVYEEALPLHAIVRPDNMQNTRYQGNDLSIGRRMAKLNGSQRTEAQAGLAHTMHEIHFIAAHAEAHVRHAYAYQGVSRNQQSIEQVRETRNYAAAPDTRYTAEEREPHTQWKGQLRRILGVHNKRRCSVPVATAETGYQARESIVPCGTTVIVHNPNKVRTLTQSVQHPISEASGTAEILPSVNVLGDRMLPDDVRGLLSPIVVDHNDSFKRYALPLKSTKQRGKLVVPPVGDDHGHDMWSVNSRIGFRRSIGRIKSHSGMRARASLP